MNMNPPFGRALACERAAQAISLRLDEELSELEVAQLRVHLDACPACRLLEQDMVGMTLEVRLMPLAVPSRQFTVPRMRAARMRSFRPLVATAAMLVVVVGSVGSLLRAGIQPQDGSSSLNFSSQFAQEQFASVEHQRIEQRANAAVTLPRDTARQRFERLQMTIGSNS
jgi:predicted anti-sigma-YlaC factor YlaD